MTSARIQPFCRKYNNNRRLYDGFSLCPRNIIERSGALFVHKNHFCLFRKSQNNSFNQAIEDELKLNFKVVDNVISDKHVKSFNKNEYKPKNVQSQLTNMIVYDIETFIAINCVPYSSCICALSQISGKYNRDITEQEHQKCLKNCIVFKGLTFNNEMLDCVLQFKGEAKRIINKIGKFNSYLLAHKESSFDSYVVLNDLPQWEQLLV